jgi:glycosyltransferase involved in cell wall biosynthesis
MGRLEDAVKRVGLLIRSFARAVAGVPNVHLLIAGDGPDAKRLKRLAQELAPQRVRFLGWVSSPHTKAALYNAADMLVLPSEREGFPTVVGEAMACGTPVLATRVGGVPELVKDGETGWLIEPGDEVSFLQKLTALVANPAMAAALRRNARNAAEDRVSSAAVGLALNRCFDAALQGYTHSSIRTISW